MSDMSPPKWELLDELPRTWDGPHVSRRLCEAIRTLRMLPLGISAGYGSTWPPYCYEWDDLVAQEQTAELERTQKLQNRTRVLPGIVEIGRMEIAICWPAEFLRPRFEIIVAVNWVAMAHSIDRDAGWVAVKRGGYADTWRQRHDVGCTIIAGCVGKERGRGGVSKRAGYSRA